MQARAEAIAAPAALAPSAPTIPYASWAERALIRVGSVLDRAMLRAMSLAFDASLMPPREELARIRESAAPYVTPELRACPERFFAFVAGLLPARLVWSRRRAQLAGGGWVISRVFRSDYLPYHCTEGDDRFACAENALVPVEHWTHPHGGAHGTVIALHGFTMGDPRFDAYPLMARRWFERGFDVALVTLPWHGARCPATSRYSGELFGSWDVGRLNEAVRQAVHDVRRIELWLRTRSDAPVGIVGLSLGGYVAAIIASVTADADFVIPIVTPVSLATVPSRMFALSRHGRGAGGAPLSVTAMEDGYRVHSPLTYTLRVPRERVLIIAGRGDRLVPPEHPQALWRHWGEPAIHWYSGSHCAPFRRSAVFAAGVRHVQTLGILPPGRAAAA